MSREHYQACFDVQTKRCVCPIENPELRWAALAPEMREMLLKLEWADEGGIEGGSMCPCCFALDEMDDGSRGVHGAKCALAALLEKLR